MKKFSSSTTKKNNFVPSDLKMCIILTDQDFDFLYLIRQKIQI